MTYGSASPPASASASYRPAVMSFVLWRLALSRLRLFDTASEYVCTEGSVRWTAMEFK
ncbi:hypothetical protein Mapa_005077 [Marchantia paleacea]|nr:hypothetical protein Mapa_005077 [Marchantia paleacea]